MVDIIRKILSDTNLLVTPMTRVFEEASDNPTLLTGLTGNYYVICLDEDALKRICTSIGKSINQIYYSKVHKCWAIRVKNKKHKKLLSEIFCNGS